MSAMLEHLLRQEKIMVICKECATNNPEGCGHFQLDQLRVAPSGDWVCDSCYDEARSSEDEPWWQDLPKITLPA